MDFSEQEKQALSQKLKDELLRQKADQLGVDSSDVMQRVFDGKISLVKKSEVYVQLDKQRKLVAPKKIVRSLRDGKNSLAAQIEDQLKRCQALIVDLVQSGEKISDEKAALVKIENRSQNIESQLAEAECRIEQIKNENPETAQAEDILRKAQELKENQGEQKAKEFVYANMELLAKFETMRKKITPHLELARKHRTGLQREYWAVMDTHYQLLSRSIKILINHLPASGENDKELGTSLKQLQKMKSSYSKLASHLPPSHVDRQKASRMWDCILPEMAKIIAKQLEIQRRIKGMHSPPTETPVSSRTDQRMAYAKQKKRG